MKPLDFDRTSYLSNGQRVFLISGELHYFRVPHQGWRDRLEKLKVAGGNCIATYVPWLLHEPEEGRFDFLEAQLDFERFLDLCQEVGVWAVVRPGPYQYSELLHGGIPDWLIKNYPQILAQKLDGSLINPDLSVSYLHPIFLEKTRHWFEAVVPRLARHQTSQGGAVAAVQIDNELMGIHEWFGSWDYHPEVMGVGREYGRWTRFLKSRYASLDHLNSSWDTQIKSWSDALPVNDEIPGQLANKRRLKDYNDFYFRAAAEFISLLGGWLKDFGIDVPLIHNSGGPGMNAYFEETLHQMGDNFLLGSDHYYNLGLDWGDGTHPTPKYASKIFYSLEMLRHLGMPPTVLEMPGGSAMDYPPILGHDLEAAYLTNLAYGMKGYNIYVFAGGKNPPGAADPSVGMSTYDYGAGIAPDGSLRELYYVEKKVADFIHAHPWLTSAQRMTDCHMGLVREYARSAHFCRVDHPDFISDYTAWTLMRKGFMMTAFCASLSPGMVDMDNEDWLGDIQKPLMLATGSALSQSIQERIVKFLRNGGKLLLAPEVPYLDEGFQSCTILSDYLGVNNQDSSSDSASGVPVLVDECTLQTIGWEFTPKAGGTVILLKHQWVAGRHWKNEMLRKALLRLGCEPILNCSNPNVWSSLLIDGEHALLFLINLLTGPLTCTVSVKHPTKKQYWDFGTHTLPGVSVKTIE